MSLRGGDELKFNTKVQHTKEKIYEDDELIKWRISWYWMGEWKEKWITEYKKEP
mgnify:CR=1 FL=1